MLKKTIDIEELEEGMLLAESIAISSGTVIIRKNTELEFKHVNLLKAAKVFDIVVFIPDKSETVKEDVTIEDYPEHLEKLKSTKVMIVDDSKLMRLKLRKIVEGAGLTIVGEAEDGQDAIAKAKELKPTFITMDIEMPNMTGIEALKPVLEVVPGARIVMISSLGDEDHIIDAISNGAIDFIIKPFEPMRTKKVLINSIIATL